MIAALFPQEVVTCDANPALISGRLYPEEEVYIQRAVPKRKGEFTAGRLCARKALARFGITNFPILVNNDRSPIWPTGFVGSITHTDGYCGVAVARQSVLLSLGVDVESVNQVSKEYWGHLFTPPELSYLHSLPSCKQQGIAALIFSAKECLYKCQYLISKQWLNFLDVHVLVDHSRNEFHAIVLVDVGGKFHKGNSMTGKYAFGNGYVFTGMAIPWNLTT